MLEHFRFAHLRFVFRVLEPLALPALNKGNVLRGAFGLRFRQLSCLQKPICGERCRQPNVCPYGRIFEPQPPEDAERLSLNLNLPRPFVIRPPLTRRTQFPPDSELSFDLLLFGSAVECFPWFVESFRKAGEAGLGPRRARLALTRVTRLRIDGSSEDAFRLGAAADRLPAETAADLLSVRPREPERLTLQFLTPTALKHEGRLIERPDFHHLFKRLRDRINALSYFYCGEPLNLDFRALGEQSEQIVTTSADTHWESRERTSGRTGRSHPMGGILGRAVYEGDFEPFWPILLLGERTHVGKHAVWGNGWFDLGVR